MKCGEVRAVRLLRDSGLAASNNEARRLIEQNAVTLITEVNDPDGSVLVADGMVLKVGKRQFVRLEIE